MKRQYERHMWKTRDEGGTESWVFAEGTDEIRYTPETRNQPGTLGFTFNGMQAEIRLTEEGNRRFLDAITEKDMFDGKTRIPKKEPDRCAGFTGLLREGALTREQLIRTLTVMDRHNRVISAIRTDNYDSFNLFCCHSDATGADLTSRIINRALDPKETRDIMNSVPRRAGADMSDLFDKMNKALRNSLGNEIYPEINRSYRILEALQPGNPDLREDLSTPDRKFFGRGPLVSVERNGEWVSTGIEDALHVFGKERKVSVSCRCRSNKSLLQAFALCDAKNNEFGNHMSLTEYSNIIARDIPDLLRTGATEILSDPDWCALSVGGPVNENEKGNGKTKIFGLYPGRNLLVFDENSIKTLTKDETKQLMGLIITDPATAYERMLDHEISNLLEKSGKWGKYDFVYTRGKTPSSQNSGVVVWTTEQQNVFGERQGKIVIRAGEKVYSGKENPNGTMSFDIMDSVTIKNGQFSDVRKTVNLQYGFDAIANLATSKPETVIKQIEDASVRKKSDDGHDGFRFR